MLRYSRCSFVSTTIIALKMHGAMEDLIVQFGEDEYWCSSNLLGNNFEYRDNKKTAYRPDNLHLIPQFPQ